MKKGFVFSVDAALGIAIVLLAIGTASMFYSGTNSDAKTFYATDQNASDNATVGFYLNQTPLNLGLSSTIASSSKQGYCGRVYYYNPDPSPANPLGTMGSPTDQNYCDQR